MNGKEIVKYLLADPSRLIQKKPFTRGGNERSSSGASEVEIGQMVEARPPQFSKKIVTQEQFLQELDPYCHDVLFNENLPSICVKVKDGDYRDVKFERMAIPFQKVIKAAQLIYLTANDMEFTLLDTDPDESQSKNFITLKQYWEDRNQDGMKNKMVDSQLSVGDAGLLYYFDRDGCIKSRLLSFMDGFVLCPHNDENGDRVLESVYYVKDDVEYIDSYDDKYMYRYTNTSDPDTSMRTGWIKHAPKPHYFNEIPLITKRGNVAWNDVQSIIEAYEEQYNIFNAIQRRFGWGIFYVKGKFKDTARKIAGNVVLNDTSYDGKGDAKFLTPPTPQGMIETLEMLFNSIQVGSGTTVLLPKDVHVSGDISGIAVQLTKELDLHTAKRNVIEWQNVANKMLRLFKYGLSKELHNKKILKNAVSEFENLKVSAKFKVWKPFNEYEYNQMIAILTGAGLLSKNSGTELNTLSKPDEKVRIEKEERLAEERQNQIMNKGQNVVNTNDPGKLIANIKKEKNDGN